MLTFLFDSNILVYSLDAKSSFYKFTLPLFQTLKDGKLSGVLAQQNILEAEHVMINRYKQDCKAVIKSLDDLISSFNFQIITPSSTTYKIYHMLLESGTRDIFDCYLAATMLDNSIKNIFTFNDKDFRSFKDIKAINPLKFKI